MRVTMLLPAVSQDRESEEQQESLQIYAGLLRASTIYGLA